MLPESHHCPGDPWGQEQGGPSRTDLGRRNPAAKHQRTEWGLLSRPVGMQQRAQREEPAEGEGLKACRAGRAGQLYPGVDTTSSPLCLSRPRVTLQSAASWRKSGPWKLCHRTVRSVLWLERTPTNTVSRTTQTHCLTVVGAGTRFGALWVEVRAWAGPGPSGGSRTESVPCPFQLPEVPASFHVRMLQASSLVSCSHLSRAFSSVAQSPLCPS